jgi:cytochrome c oxidase subunit 2
VTAQQFAWTFKYPDQNGLTSTVLRLPIDRPARFTLRALDVLHSFWVPEFSQKQDAVPGTTTKVTITPNKLGTFRSSAPSLRARARGHALDGDRDVEGRVREVGQEGSQAGGGGGGGGGGGAAAGKAVFANNGCGACHTLQAAKSTGKVGPDLDKLPGYAQKAGMPLENSSVSRSWIQRLMSRKASRQT